MGKTPQKPRNHLKIAVEGQEGTLCVTAKVYYGMYSTVIQGVPS